jgi:hypothetical protein
VDSRETRGSWKRRLVWTGDLALRLTAALNWRVFLPAGALALAFAWAAERAAPDALTRHIPTRLALLSAALAIVFAFDDPASPLTDPAPSPLRIRRSLRLCLAGTAWAAITGLVLMITGSGMEPGSWPSARFWLEAATLATVGLTSAAALSRRDETEPGRYASAILLALVGIAWFLPRPLALFVEPGDRYWQSVETWWWIILAGALVAGVATSWDTQTNAWLPSRFASRTEVRITDQDPT